MDAKGYLKASFCLGILILLLGLSSAKLVCQPYDDFSSGILNASKWTESNTFAFHGSPFTSEHFINITEGGYSLIFGIRYFD